MKIISLSGKMQAACCKYRQEKKTIGFVPTMGALHRGHLSLIRACRSQNDITIVSIFVNPAQFGPQEDFSRYPRPLKKDIALCGKVGVDFIFLPRVKDMYPAEYKTYVYVEGLSGALCGKSRQGHFRGVTTVVAKLFNITQPDIAYFGQKDGQQAIVIKKMVSDLNLPVRIRVMPTIREKDGLALSSRNLYLSKGQRKDAIVLSEALKLSRRLIGSGLKDADRIIAKMKQLIKAKKTARVDYISIAGLENLKPLKKIDQKCLVALAVWFGKIRLIDNMIIKEGVRGKW